MQPTIKLNVLAGCEKSGQFRRAVQALGHTCYSCDMLSAEDGETDWHVQGDIVEILHNPPNGIPWDLALVHVPCTRLTRAGQRWLNFPPPGKTLEQMWDDFDANIALFEAVWNSPVPFLAIENPRMHIHAKERLEHIRRKIQYTQPYWFGHPMLKETGYHTRRLCDLVPTNYIKPPVYGTPEYTKWQTIRNMPNTNDRAEIRARSLSGVAEACASQWCAHIVNVKLGKYKAKTIKRVKK